MIIYRLISLIIKISSLFETRSSLHAWVLLKYLLNLLFMCVTLTSYWMSYVNIISEVLLFEKKVSKEIQSLTLAGKSGRESNPIRKDS